MQEQNELNDIILNKGGAANSNKKIILAVATLGVILIIVVMLMNSLSSSGTDNLPQAMLPPEPQTQELDAVIEEPLFEEVEVVQEESSSDADLDMIAQKLKQESLKENIQEDEEEIVAVEAVKAKKIIKPTVKKKVVTKKPTAYKTKTSATGSYYVQVGSFSKYEPDKKFLSSIKKLGYNYKYHNISNINKVLVGPFKTSSEAKNARRVLRSKVEPGAFLVNLK